MGEPYLLSLLYAGTRSKMTVQTSVKEPSLEGFLTTREVAEMYGVTQVDVQRAIKGGHIKAQKVGDYFYLIWEPSLPQSFPR